MPKLVQLKKRGDAAYPMTTPQEGVIALSSGVSIAQGFVPNLFKSSDGFVFLQTRFVKTVSVTGYTLIGTLPVGYRPVQLLLSQYTNENGDINYYYIDANGNIFAHISNINFKSMAIDVSFKAKE